MDPIKYWDERLKDYWGLESVGCLGLGELNKYVYRAKVRTLERAVRRLHVNFNGKEVLDVGSGTGFWIDYYLSRGASLVYGVDISHVAIENLKKKYKSLNNVKLFEGDFSEVGLDRKFDVVNAFDVAYHVVDDVKFTKFAQNLCIHIKDGGFLFLTDTFRHDYREEAMYVRFRALTSYDEILEEFGVRVILVLPMYSILGYPFTGKRGLDYCLNTLFSLITNFLKNSETAAKLAYHLDTTLTQVGAFGISTKMLVGKKAHEFLK